jgi:CRISP-associated protein Cas1
MATAPFNHFIARKPPASEQFNWLTETFEREPEQLEFDDTFQSDVFLPEDQTISLLATENGAQLFVSGFGLYIGKKSERLTIRHQGKLCAQVPFLKLQELVIAGRGISLSSDLIDELCSRGIRIAFLSNSGRPNALLTSPLLTATVLTRRSQLAAIDSAVGVEFARRIVAGKLRNQEKLLRYFAKSRSGQLQASLQKAADQIGALCRQSLRLNAADMSLVRFPLLGLEGTAGRLYWGQIAKIVPDFSGRLHQADQSPVNAALNFGYGILYSHVWGAVMNAGLEPFAGFVHTDRPGKPSLVLDLIEEFRQPVVDRPLFAWLTKGGSINLKNGLLDGASKDQVASRILQRLNSSETYQGKSHQVRSIIQMQTRQAASFFKGNARYRPFAFQW